MSENKNEQKLRQENIKLYTWLTNGRILGRDDLDYLRKENDRLKDWLLSDQISGVEWPNGGGSTREELKKTYPHLFTD